MLANPNYALLTAALGLLGIYVEMSRPGRVIPGIAGGIALLTGIASLARADEPPSPMWSAAILVPLAVVTLWLSRIAVRARRNKRS